MAFLGTRSDVLGYPTRYWFGTNIQKKDQNSRTFSSIPNLRKRGITRALSGRASPYLANF
jgi:hypothetical protein